MVPTNEPEPHSMKIRVWQRYGCFSYTFEKWLAAQLNKRVQPSDSFAKKYGRDWLLIFVIDPNESVPEEKIWKPEILRQRKELEWTVTAPFPDFGPLEPSFYSRPVRLIIKKVATMLGQFGIDSSKILQDLPTLMKHFEAEPKMVNARRVKELLRNIEEVNALALEEDDAPPAKRAPSRPIKKRRAAMPKWRVPKRLDQIVEEDGCWEDERFDPLLLTVMSGTSYRGRAIPLAWQIEFEPSDERLEYANTQLEGSDVEPDGEGWSEVVRRRFAAKHPKLARQLHSDSESSTCVLWVESEDACKRLVELVWRLIYPK